MPPQNPVTRIEAVARDLGRLAAEAGDELGPEGVKALHHWQKELRTALEDIQRLRSSTSGA